MKTFIMFLLTLYYVTSVHGQENKPTNFSVPNVFSNSVDDLDNRKNDISMVDENGNVTYKSQQEIERQLNTAIQLYKSTKFETAFPIISELSQWGLKDAQAILGGMYLKGEFIDKSTERGLLWLGVAKEDRLQKKARESFDYIYSQLSDEHKAYIDGQVEEHINKFGSDAQNISCKRVSEVGSNLKVTKCYKESGSDSLLYPIP